MSTSSKYIIKRDTVLLYLFGLVLLVVLMRAFYIQVYNSDFYINEGDKRHIRVEKIVAPRGEILDRNGNVLALSTPVCSIGIDYKILYDFLKPSKEELDKLELTSTSTSDDFTKKEINIAKEKLDLIKENGVKLEKVLAILQLDFVSTVTDIVLDEKREFKYIARKIRPALCEKIKDINLYGVIIENSYKRYYPAGKTVSQLVGYMASTKQSNGQIARKGIAGVEQTFDEWLTGLSGKQKVIKDRIGNTVDYITDIKLPQAGGNLTLSIDKDLQFFLEKALKEVMITYKPKATMSVILDAKTGEILASVSLPANNPNDRSLSSWQIKNSKNRVVEDVFEPGSTVKPFVVALALDEEQVKSDEKINTSPGSIRVQGNRITDDRDKGVLSVGEILEKSSNVGMVKISKRLTSKSMWNMYQKLGFTQLSGTFLPGESSGYMKEWQEWQPIDQAAASYGYSISANILQLARAYTVFANDGKILPISLRKKDMSLKEHHEQVFSAKTANLVLKMMERVVNKGTAPLARIPGYRVAGKTGTSHINLKDRKGYENNEYNSFFAGIVPASDPKFIMITMANKPSLGVYFGGEIAGPVFSKVMKQALRLYNISPDK